VAPKTGKNLASSDIDQSLVKALAHPLRQRVFTMLSERVASPSELATELGEPLGNVAYHVQVLNGLGCLELVSTTPVRGAVEHHYRAVKRPFFDDAQWARLPQGLRNSISGGVLADIWEDVRDALTAGTFARRDDAHLSRMNLVLDEQGWVELSDLLNDLLEQAHALQAEAAARLASTKEPIPVTTKLALMHYESAPGAEAP